jgi:cytochrome c553
MSFAFRTPWKRIVTFTLSALLLAALAVAAVGRVRWSSRQQRKYLAPLLELAVATEPQTIARGRHLAHTLGGCAECHGADLGGRVLEDGPLLRLVGPNLTAGKGSATDGYRDRDWARAIVHGLNRSGRSLLVMPSRELRGFSDDDVAAMIAYVKAVPPVDRVLPPTQVHLLGSIMAGLLELPLLSAESIDHRAPRPQAPPPGPTRAYGAYLLTSCRGCHGSELRGGIRHNPDHPPSADLSQAAMASWDYASFERALRQGKRRDGSDLSPAMPWQATRGLEDDELRAIWLALRGR